METTACLGKKRVIRDGRPIPSSFMSLKREYWNQRQTDTHWVTSECSQFSLPRGLAPTAIPPNTPIASTLTRPTELNNNARQEVTRDFQADPIRKAHHLVSRPSPSLSPMDFFAPPNPRQVRCHSVKRPRSQDLPKELDAHVQPAAMFGYIVDDSFRRHHLPKAQSRSQP